MGGCSVTFNNTRYEIVHTLYLFGVLYFDTVDCIMSNYTVSPVCSSTCGSGIMVAYAAVVVYPRYGGNECPSRVRAWAVCYPQDCRK